MTIYITFVLKIKCAVCVCVSCHSKAWRDMKPFVDGTTSILGRDCPSSQSPLSYVYVSMAENEKVLCRNQLSHDT